jgi:hypothetical protein
VLDQDMTPADITDALNRLRFTKNQPSLGHQPSTGTSATALKARTAALSCSRLL